MAASGEGGGAPGGVVHGRRAANRAGWHGGGDGRGRETRGIHVVVMIDMVTWTKCCTGWRYAIGEGAWKTTVDPSDRPVICFVGSECLGIRGVERVVVILRRRWRRKRVLCSEKALRDGGIRLSGIAEMFDAIHG